MSKTRQVYFCYTCSEEVTFRGTRIRYNLDGNLHLCKAEDKLAYEKYHEYIRREDFWTGWRLTGEDFWKWKREIYDVQRWTQSRDYYNELKEQREREQQRASAEAEAVIKDKFRTLALKFHPDRKGGDTAKFREMNEAYEYLMRRCTG